MKKGIAYLLLALYLCATTEAYQLLKLPALVSHFITHSRLEPGTTIFSFLEEHYSGETVYDDDWQQDMELPFKCCECTPLAFPVTLQAEVPDLKAPPIIEVFIAFTPTLRSLHSKLQAEKIFQPPRPFSV